MYLLVDAKGFYHSLLDSILDFKKYDNVVDKEDIYVTTKSGQRCVRKTTAGLKLLVLWKNNTEKLTPLYIMNNSNPLDIA